MEQRFSRYNPDKIKNIGIENIMMLGVYGTKSQKERNRF
jgi:hypothetical protein